MDLWGRGERQGDEYGRCSNSLRERWQDPDSEWQMAHVTAVASSEGTSTLSRNLERERLLGIAWATGGVLSSLPEGERPKLWFGEALVGGSPDLSGQMEAGDWVALLAREAWEQSTAAFLRCFYYFFKYKKLNPFYDLKLAKVL